LSKIFETISASFAARICNRVRATNPDTIHGRGGNDTNIQYEILGLLATAKGREVGEPTVVMLIE
jgi:hypothetical protein